MDIFDSLSQQKDAQQQAQAPPVATATPASGQPAGGGDVFDKLAQGQDVHLPGENPQLGLGEIDPSDKGFTKSLKRNTVGLLRLPGHVINAFSQGPQDSDDMEKAMRYSMVGGKPDGEMDGRAKFGLQAMLGFKRLIVDPMLQQHKLAEEYSKLYDNLSPEQRKEYEKRISAADAQHLANMHHMASVIPLLGPVAGDITDRMYNGDVSGGLTDVLFNIATAGLMKKLAGKAKGLAPGERVIAGEKVPTLASQEGNSAAAGLETAAKGAGGGARISRFVEEQQGSLRKATGNIADAATHEAIQKMNNSAAPTALSKAANFEEASDILRTAARPKLEVVDKITNGRLSEIWDERDALLEKAKSTNQFSAQQAIQKQLADLSAEESQVLSPRNLKGQFQKTITNAQRDAAVKAARVWKQANSMEELHAAIEGGAGDGAAIAKRISALDPGTVDSALGGNATHVAAVKEIAQLLGSGAKAALVNNVLRLVKFVAQKGSLGASQVGGQAISKILTSRAAANALATGIKAGATAPVIAESIDKILEREQKAQ